MNRFGAMSGAIRRLAGERLFGPAFPVRTVAGDNRTLHLALEQVPSGSVLVVDAAGHLGRAVWGEVLTHAAQQAGVAGLVLDGVTRDLDEIRRRRFPLYGRGACPAGPHKGWVGDIGVPVCCGGVVVAPGDLVLGDADGVVVVPGADAANVLTAAERRAGDEQEWMDRISAGQTSAAVLGISRQRNAT